MLRLLLRPAWVRFLVWATTCGALFAAGNSFMSRSAWAFLASGLFFGVIFGAFLVYQTQPVHQAATQAVAGLTSAELSQACDAVLHGVTPGAGRVRSAAARLGRAYLRDKTPEQFKRQERQTWITLALLVAGDVALVVLYRGEYEGLHFAALGVVILVAMPLQIRHSRRIQRNVAALADASIF